ncbi:TetR/AcrR family transcriptional regulator [Pseudanabaena sp. FACHB-2040]|uniref:TetR/AcrR family transcriptional regulator n=1 Tax=Pseudanabaena sp. FACHB-2040 TaxID=2692859 RepID=UPI001688009C|nr:TetR/AcrR family transcriptional regulator [Pseudanabaena sp. FACHB-2040]MBD2257408.1 TetR family transcriptional regulator [Pseudanabaena sp. FACHB-2040]
MIPPSQNAEPLRRVPQQARSRQRFNQILDAAAQIFAEVGYEAASTELIAARARTSIGSLYRFFPDKFTLLLALAERFAERMRELFAAHFNAAAVQEPLAQIISKTVDAFDALYTTQPGCRTVMLQSRVSPELQAVNMRVDREIVVQLETFLALRQPQMGSERRRLVAFVSVEIAGALQLLSLAQDEQLHQQIVAETKAVLLGYLGPLFPDPL